MNFKLIRCGFVQSGVLSILGLMALATPSQALVINGGFENGLNNWTTTGDVSTPGTFNGFTPPQGAAQALLNTGATADGEDQYSANAPVNSSLLESFLGLAPGALDTDALEGSGLTQTFTLSTAGNISFDWRFLGEADFPDRAFVVVNGDLTLLATAPGSTGLLSYTSGLLNAGSNTIGFGLIDVDDFAGASQLLIDNVSFTATPSVAIPVPPQVAATALAGVIGLLKKRRCPTKN
jgi:hypothetical protein